MRPIWTNEGSKRVVPRFSALEVVLHDYALYKSKFTLLYLLPLKEVPFGGLNNVPLNFGGKIPQKLKFWGRE